MKDKRKFFTTGEFAKSCNVSKQTLIYYDKIGLLQPDFVDTNQYRYYSVHQLERFAVIDLLKRLDTPLVEIQQFLNEKSLEEAIYLLDEKERVIRDKMNELRQLQTVIDTKRALIQEAGEVTQTIRLEWMEEEQLVVSDPIVALTEKELSEQLMQFVQQFNVKERDAGYPMCRLFSTRQFMEGQYETGGRLYIRVERAYTLPHVVKEAGTYAVAYHVGDYATIGTRYDTFKQWMFERDLIPRSDVYEQYMLDEIVSSDTEQYVTKMMVRVEKRRA